MEFLRPTAVPNPLQLREFAPEDDRSIVLGVRQAEEQFHLTAAGRATIEELIRLTFQRRRLRPRQRAPRQVRRQQAVELGEFLRR
jgi:hypothetical protein